VIILGVIIPQAEGDQLAVSAITFCFYKPAGLSGHTGPVEDTGVHLLVDQYLVLGHQCL